MERMTYDFCIGDTHCWQIKGADNLECREVCQMQEDKGCEDCPIAKAFDRLASYEDTGLEPEEIAKIREDVENGYLKSTARRYGISVDRLRELAQADREGRCVVLNMPSKPLVWGDDDKETCLCPYCGKDLMGIPYGERMVLQGPECGQYLDATKVITRAEAQEALRREQDG